MTRAMALFAWALLGACGGSVSSSSGEGGASDASSDEGTSETSDASGLCCHIVSSDAGANCASGGFPSAYGRVTDNACTMPTWWSCYLDDAAGAPLGGNLCDDPVCQAGRVCGLICPSDAPNCLDCVGTLVPCP
jgi:hypothetical protein